MHQITLAVAALCIALVRGNSTCPGCHTPICGENEVPVRGHPRRDKFCRPAYTPRDVLRQRRKCVCKPTYVRNSWNECVPRKLCRRCKCRLQKDWHMCSSACPVTYNMRLPICSKMCVPGCDCPPGWVVDSRNWKRCVKANKFPPICPPHSTFQPCVSNCLPRCGIIAPKTCVSSCHRGACVCDDGFAEFWGHQGRVCVRQEKCEWHYRNLLILIRAGSNGAGAGMPGGSMHPGGWVIGPWGAISPSVIGLPPVIAGINGGSALLTSTNTAGGAHSGAREGITTLSMTGTPGSVSAGSGVVGVGMHGTGVNAPAGALSAAGISPSGATGNVRGGPVAIFMSGPSRTNTGVGNAPVNGRGGVAISAVAPSGGTVNGVGGAGIGVVGGNIGNMAEVGGAGFSSSGGRVPFSVSTASAATEIARGSTGVGFTGSTLGGIARSGSTGASGSSTPFSIAPGTSRNSLGTSLVGSHPRGATITHSSSTITNTIGTVGPHRGGVSVNSGGASLGGGSEFRGPGIPGSTRNALLRGGAVVGGSRVSENTRNPLLSGSARVGGSSVGLNGGDTSLNNRTGFVESGVGANVGGASVISGARGDGYAVGAVSRGAHLVANGSFSSSGERITGTGSLSRGGRGDAVSTESTSLRNRVGGGGVRVNAGNDGILLVTAGSGGNSFNSRVTGLTPHIGVPSTANTGRTLAPTTSISTIRNGGGSAGVHSVGTGSDSAAGNLNVAVGSVTGGNGAAVRNVVGTASVINGVASMPGATTAGSIEMQPSGNSRNSGHHLDISHSSTSRNSLATVREGAELNGASGSLTATTGPTATITSLRETVSTTSSSRHPEAVSGASSGGGISITVSGIGTNRGASASSVTSGIPHSSNSVILGASGVPIGAGNARSRVAETNSVAISGAIPVVISLPGNSAHGANGGSIGARGSLRTESAHSSISLTSGGSNASMNAAGVHTHTNGALGGNSGSTTTAGVTLGTESVHSGPLVNSGGYDGAVNAESIHLRIGEGNRLANAGTTSLGGNGLPGGSGIRTNSEGVSSGRVTGTGVVGIGGANMHAGHGGASFSEGTLPGGTVVVLSPGSTATSGVAGSGISGGNGGSASVFPAGGTLILPLGTGTGGSLSTVTPAATTTTAATGSAGVGRSGGLGPVVSVNLGAANTSTGFLSGTGNTGTIGSTGTTGVSVHTGPATSTRAIGSESSVTTSYPAVTLVSGNEGHGSVSLVFQPGGASSSEIRYGVPPIATLRSGSLPATALSSGGSASSHLSDLSSSTNGGVDVGEAQPITQPTTLGPSSVNNTGSVVA